MQAKCVHRFSESVVHVLMSFDWRTRKTNVRKKEFSSLNMGLPSLQFIEPPFGRDLLSFGKTVRLSLGNDSGGPFLPMHFLTSSNYSPPLLTIPL